MNAEELQAYLSEPEPVDPSLPSKQPDPTSIPVVVENVADTSPSNQQDQDSSEDDDQTTEMTDSSYFGGFLLGEGLGGGSDNSLDRFPVFPGGTEGVRRYLEMNVKYPNLAIKQKISGVVLVSFRVNKFGEVDHIKVERGINALIDSEAIKAIEAMPRWKPGMRHGKPINVTFIIPVNFMPLG
jgi:TonB family protein